jgi:hypothetical protein
MCKKTLSKTKGDEINECKIEYKVESLKYKGDKRGRRQRCPACPLKSEAN